MLHHTHKEVGHHEQVSADTITIRFEPMKILEFILMIYRILKGIKYLH